MASGQDYSFGFADSLLAEIAGVPQALLHYDIDVICKAYDAVAPLAERLGVQPPQPRLAGMAYNHVSTLGAQVSITPQSPEPQLKPCIHSPEDIDKLKEPADYLSAGIVPQRLELVAKLKERRPDANERIGHNYEGAVTSAVLMMGQDFLTLPYDDPARAHRLLEFLTRSAANYARALGQYQNNPLVPAPRTIPDDFAGMFSPAQFGEFVVPYWDKLYQATQATERILHSELLRPEHLPFLKELQIDLFDPGVDQYLTGPILRQSCPAKYKLQIRASEVQVHSPQELVEMYRRRAGFGPLRISFYLGRLADEAKIAALLQVARELT